MEILNCEEKEMIPLTDEETKSYEKQEVCHICKKEVFFGKNEGNEFKLYHKVRDQCHYTWKFRGAALSICSLSYKVPKQIPVVIPNAGYDTHFITEQLAEEVDGQFDCIGENIEKYITLSVPIKKNLIMVKKITCKLKLIDSFTFMPTSLSSVADNLSEINKIEWKTY